MLLIYFSIVKKVGIVETYCIQRISFPSASHLCSH